MVFLKFSIKDRQIMSFPTTLSKARVYQGCLAGTIKPCHCPSWGGHCYCSICPLPDKSHYSCGHTPLAGPGEPGCDGEKPLAPGRAHPGQGSSETCSGWGGKRKKGEQELIWVLPWVCFSPSFAALCLRGHFPRTSLSDQTFETTLFC